MTDYGADVPPLQCRSCFHKGEPDLGWQVFANGTQHIRAECRQCGSFIQYMHQHEEDGSPSLWQQAAPRRAT